ncbi:mannosyl-glycoprotein endo-beta-N-acetylglucosaminidase, partial [Gracilibacillus halophilus YIM-C55.5]
MGKRIFILLAVLLLLSPMSLLGETSDSSNEDLSADELFEKAQDEPTASGKLDLYINGYETYPEDGRFEEGIQRSVGYVLDWARIKHNNGDYATAIDRYNAILNAPGVNDTLVAQTEKHLTNANEEQPVPQANALYKEATNKSTVSGIFNAFVKGYNWYPNDDRFVDGLKESEEQLFNWALAQHNNGRYDTAIDRYNMILNAPIADNKLLNRVKEQLEAAKNGNRQSDAIYQEAQEEPT